MNKTLMIVVTLGVLGTVGDIYLLQPDKYEETITIYETHLQTFTYTVVNIYSKAGFLVDKIDYTSNVKDKPGDMITDIPYVERKDTISYHRSDQIPEAMVSLGKTSRDPALREVNFEERDL